MGCKTYGIKRKSWRGALAIETQHGCFFLSTFNSELGKVETFFHHVLPQVHQLNYATCLCREREGAICATHNEFEFQAASF